MIYGERAMRHFKEIGTVVYLKLPYTEVEQRLGNLKSRDPAYSYSNKKIKINKRAVAKNQYEYN